MNEHFDLIWHTPPPDVDPERTHFEFGWKVTNDKMEDIEVTVSGFWDFWNQKIEELTILDKMKRDVTSLYDNEDYLMAIEKEVKLNIL